MALADTFQQILDSLPDDWSFMDVDVRVYDETRYIEASTYMVQVNPQPYSKHDWHWHVNVAHRFGHAAAAPAVLGTFRLLDQAGIAGELKVRNVRVGRAEVVPQWGRPESVRQEFRKIRAQ
jgi:hypothetical protein